MKKNIYSVLMAASAMFATPAMAEEVTFNFAGNPWGIEIPATTSNLESNIEGLKEGVVTLTTGSYATSSGYKAVLYKASSKPAPYLFAGPSAGFVLTADNGYEIQQIVFNMEGTARTYNFNPAKTDVNKLGNISSYSTSTKSMTWTPNEGTTGAQQVDFKATSLQINSMVITVGKAAATGGGDDEKVSKRMLMSTSTYGDALGETSDDICTAKKLYYYDKNLNIQAVVNNKTEHRGLIYSPVDYNSYEYNEKGQLVAIHAYQYGAFEYLQRAMKPSVISTTYEYDEKGNMIASTEAGQTTTYEYDADGNLVKEIFPTGKTVEYSGFVGKNKYTFAVSTHTNTNAEAEYYDEEVTYDEKGNKTAAYRVYNRDNSYKLFGKEYGHHVGDFLSLETWEYDEDGIMTLYTKAMQQDELTGEPLANAKTVYERVDGNINAIRRTTYDARYIDDEVEGRTVVWSRRSTPFVDEYIDFEGKNELCDMTISVKADENDINTALVSFDMPKLSETDNNMHMNLYRDGEFVATIPVMTIQSNDNDYNITLDETNGKMVYHDRLVKNGWHEYFVTAVESSAPQAAPGLGVDDETGDNMGVVTLELTELCASNKATVDLYTALPKAINLNASGKTSASNGAVRVYIDFDYEPGHTTPEYGFKESFLVNNGSGYPDDDERCVAADSNTKQVSREFEGNGKTSVQIVTRYALGIATSDPYEFNPADIDIVTNIDALNASLSAGKTMLFDLNGRQVSNATKGVFIKVADGKATKIVIE